VSLCEDDLSAEAERPVDSDAGLKLDCAEYYGCSNPTVEVVRTEEENVVEVRGEVDSEAPAASVDKAAPVFEEKGVARI
jgi:hypothetical protein